MSELRNPGPGGVCFNIKFLPAVTVSEVPRPPAAPPHSRHSSRPGGEQSPHRHGLVFGYLDLLEPADMKMIIYIFVFS